MEFKNVSINIKNSNLLRLPLNQKLREVIIDPSVCISNSEVTLICYKIHLLRENQYVLAYLLRNINPISVWYKMKIRDGDRLITLNGQDITRMSHEDVYSIINEKKLSFTCQVIWHPELYIEFGDLILTKNHLHCAIKSQRLIDDNMYEYLADILRNVLDYHPEEPYLLFKKQELSNDNNLNPVVQRQLTLLSNRSTIEGSPEETMRNLLEINTLFERIDIGLNRDEIYWIWLSMKALLHEKPNIQKLRFWGKIFGIKNNYYIVEADFDVFDNLELDDSEFIKYQQAFSVEEEEENTDYIHTKGKVPPEPIGTGVNQKIFYVSSGVDQSFVQLPLLTPEQIELSRKIQQFFIGDLDASVKCNSNFPGVEKHLLRAQIQRISAGTQIAPKDYLKNSFNEQEQMGEELIERTNLDMNNKLEDLALSNGQYWIHYVPFINQQGRNENSPIEYNPSIDQDITIDGLDSAWSVGIASTLVPEHTLVYVRSNRWPGAFTLGDRHRFEYIYIGWGIKNFIEDHQANLIDIFPENEYEFEMIEMDDPIIDEENDLFKSAILLSPDEDEQFEID